MLHDNTRVRWRDFHWARFGMLMGMGYDAGRIAADTTLKSTEKAIRAKAARVELRFRDCPATLIGPEVEALFDREAERYAFTGKQLIKILFRTLAENPTLIHNVVDLEG